MNGFIDLYGIRFKFLPKTGKTVTLSAWRQVDPGTVLDWGVHDVNIYGRWLDGNGDIVPKLHYDNLHEGEWYVVQGVSSCGTANFKKAMFVNYNAGTTTTVPPLTSTTIPIEP